MSADRIRGMRRRATAAKRASPKRRTVRPKSDKFIIGMVVMTKDGPKLKMFEDPFVYDDYDKALKGAATKYERHPNAKFVVFAKVATVGAPFLAPKIEEYKF